LPTASGRLEYPSQSAWRSAYARQMGADTYRVEIAFDLLAEPDPKRLVGAAVRFVRLLPPGSEALVIESKAAGSDGLARVAATVPAHGPAEALRDVARAVEVMAAEAGRLDALGPMRRAFVEYLGD
jgi:hypothetical protein